MAADLNSLLPIGTKTQWGTVQSVLYDGERYYFLIDERGCISMMPASTVEESVQPRPARGN